MMDFTLTEEQRQLQALARRFAREVILPVAAEYDRKEEVPWPVIEKLHEVGLLNAIIPEAYGGMGLKMVDEVIVGEELAYACMGIYTIPMASDLGITPILLAGTPEQKERFLRPLTQKPALAAFALSEPGNGSDAAALRTRAVREGDFYILNGTKMWISNGGEAEWVVVFATLNPELRHKGVVA
ncbi:MAG: acyl-CoA dehydrogenase, partial [Thermus sp.]